MSKQLQDKVALITGGTSGIGLATALRFYEQGARVVVTGQSQTNIDKAKAALPDDVLVLKADARSLADSARVASEIERRFGGLDVVFLNAGVAQFAPIELSEEALFDDIFDVNVKGLFYTLKAVLPLLRQGASIIANTSVVSTKGIANASVYSASKAAVGALVRSLSVELAPKGVRVNSISPGPIETPIYDKLGLPAEAVAGFRQGMTGQVPLRRFGASDEVAQAALFLASTASSYVTGTELPVDGGLGAA